MQMDAAERLKMMSPQGKTGTLLFDTTQNGEHYWTFKARNGETISSCLPETYKNKGDMLKNVHTILFCKWSIDDDKE